MNADANNAARLAEALGAPFAGFSAHDDRWRRVRVSTRVLSIEALIEEKKALGRSEDLAVLPLLEAARAAQHRKRGAKAD